MSKRFIGARQTTVAREIELTGTGVHSGAPVSLILHPAESGVGLRFLASRNGRIAAEIPANVSHVKNLTLCTVIGDDTGITIGTVEHLLAALRGLAIDNCYIEIDSKEVPIMDGSSAAFVEAIDEAGIRDKVMRALQILSLEGTAQKSPAELSGGMRKRVAIARGLVMEPQLMLYDEPTSELDPVMSATISEIIATLKEEIRVTSIVVSHDRELALGIADRVGILMGGELVSLGTPAELRQTKDPRVVEFLNPTIDLKHPRFKKLET